MKDGRWIRREGGGCGKGEGRGRREPEGMFGKKSRLGAVAAPSLARWDWFPGSWLRMDSSNAVCFLSSSSSSSSIATISLLPLVYTGATPSICSRSPLLRSFCVQFREPMQPTLSLSLSARKFPRFSSRFFATVCHVFTNIHEYKNEISSPRLVKLIFDGARKKKTCSGCIATTDTPT